jgi:hypothetical protein
MAPGGSDRPPREHRPALLQMPRWAQLWHASPTAIDLPSCRSPRPQPFNDAVSGSFLRGTMIRCSPLRACRLRRRPRSGRANFRPYFPFLKARGATLWRRAAGTSSLRPGQASHLFIVHGERPPTHPLPAMRGSGTIPAGSFNACQPSSFETPLRALKAGGVSA